MYEYIATAVFYLSIVLSLAEMASMAPTSGERCKHRSRSGDGADGVDGVIEAANITGTKATLELPMADRLALSLMLA